MALADFVCAKSLEETSAYRLFGSLVASANLPLDPSNFTPMSFVKVLEKSSVSHVSLYLDISAFILALRAKQGSLPAFASALRAWASFCNLLGSPHFPVQLDSAVKFSAIFREHGTFCAYLSHVKSACELLQLPSVWAESPCLLRAKKGLEKAALVFKGPRLAVLGKDVVKMASFDSWTHERFFCIFRGFSCYVRIVRLRAWCVILRLPLRRIYLPRCLKA